VIRCRDRRGRRPRAAPPARPGGPQQLHGDYRFRSVSCGSSVREGSVIDVPPAPSERQGRSGRPRRALDSAVHVMPSRAPRSWPAPTSFARSRPERREDAGRSSAKQRVPDRECRVAPWRHDHENRDADKRQETSRTIVGCGLPRRARRSPSAPARGCPPARAAGGRRRRATRCRACKPAFSARARQGFHSLISIDVTLSFSKR
jgi:hypothetical protein